MIHSAKFGSLERFIGILVEHYAGAFPMWLSPVQAVVVPVADRHVDYAGRVADQLRERAGLRVEVEAGSGKLGEKVRRAITDKTPAILVVGDDDVESSTAGIRMRGEEEERGVVLEEVVRRLRKAAAPPR